MRDGKGRLLHSRPRSKQPATCHSATQRQSIGTNQPLRFAIGYGSQATIYAIRERGHLWGLRPTIWLVSSSAADLLIISTLALRGIAMAPLSLTILAGKLGAAVVFGLVLDAVKIPIFARLCIA
jgi:hypothetical protein